MNCTYLAIVSLLAVWSALAQTRIDLGKQTRNVDFSGATSTRPARIGLVLPSTCQLGEMFFKADESPGTNLYGCSAAGVWTKLGAASSMPALAGQQSKALFSNGTDAVWAEAVKTVSPSSGLIITCSAGAGPMSGDCWLELDDWYAATQGKRNVFTGVNDFSGAASFRVKSGIALPAACSVAEVFFKTSSAPGLNWYGCTSPNTWSLLSGGSGGDGGNVLSVFGRVGEVIAKAGDYSAAQVTNAVDASAVYSNPSWIGSLAWEKIAGRPSLPVNTDGLPEGVGNRYFTNERALSAVTWSSLQGKPLSFAPTAHRNQHASGGGDALAPADIGAQPVLGYVAEDASKKGQPNGYAPLDSNSKVPIANLPASTGFGSATVLKCATGSSTSATSAQTLGSYTFASGDLAAGDLVRVQSYYTHEPGANGTLDAMPVQGPLWGSSAVYAAWAATSDTILVTNFTLSIADTSETYFDSALHRGTGGIIQQAPRLLSDNVNGGITLALRGYIPSNGDDVLTLRHYCVERLRTQ